MSGIETSARVFIQDRKTAQIVELPYFSNITSTLTMQGVGTASVTFSNKDDRFFTGVVRKRDFSTRSDVLDYLKSVFNLGLVTEVSRKRADLANALRTKPHSDAQLRQFLELQFDCELELMTRIWIDYKGRDGLWYAGFTGIVSGITDVLYDQESMPQLTLGCKDMRRFLQLSQVIRTGGDLGLLAKTPQDFIQGANTPEGFRTRQDVFSGIDDPAGIIGTLLNLTNKFFGPDGGTGIGVPPVYGMDRFWQLFGTSVTTPDRLYDGVVNMRATNPLLAVGAGQPLNGRMPDPDLCFAPNPVRAIPATVVAPEFLGFPAGERGFGYGQAGYLVDKTIHDVKALRDMIRENYTLYNVQRVEPERVISEVMNTTLFDFWVDAMGNAIFQRPRYDDLPNWQALDRDDRGLAYNPEHDTFESPQQRDSSYSGLRGHGQNYLLGDASLLRFTSSQDETRLHTVVVVNSPVNWLELDATIQNLSTIGAAVATPQLIAQLGVRIFQAQAPVLETWGKQVTQRHLNRAAGMLLRRLNAMADTFSAECTLRPDLQPGRTVLAVERNKLFYMREVTHNVVPGQPGRTSLCGDFGHLPEEPISDPWTVANEDTVTSLLNSLSSTFIDITDQGQAAALQRVVPFQNVFQSLRGNLLNG